MKKCFQRALIFGLPDSVKDDVASVKKVLTQRFPAAPTPLPKTPNEKNEKEKEKEKEGMLCGSLNGRQADGQQHRLFPVTQVTAR
jgi:hypothetical protein